CSPISRTSLKTIRHSKAYIISAKSPLKSLRTIDTKTKIIKRYDGYIMSSRDQFIDEIHEMAKGFTKKEH
ncbi:MAG: hypothetical protein ABMA02_17600, partial [Saprospiraceae bacterium]